MSILETILQSTRAEVEQRKLAAQPAPVATSARPAGRLRAALTQPGIGVIAEIKRRSPSAGELRADVDVAAIAAAYEQGGAGALSVLTEGPHFGGSLEDLRAARAACSLPILRKDFIVDEFQLHEALAAGADAVLLIVAALSAEQLAGLHAQASAIGLDVLVEVHDERELETALAAGAQIVGVNNRDLRDFTVDIERTFALLAQMPPQTIVVSESGIASAEQLHRFADAGVSAVLVGESLMRAQDPAAALAALRGHPANF
jgi:indole-3-glycerol phosphate synthase